MSLLCNCWIGTGMSYILEYVGISLNVLKVLSGYVRHWHVKLNCWNEIRFWESKTQTLVFNEFQSCLVLLESDSCDVASGLFKAEARLLHMFEMENVWLNTKLQD